MTAAVKNYEQLKKIPGLTKGTSAPARMLSSVFNKVKSASDALAVVAGGVMVTNALELGAVAAMTLAGAAALSVGTGSSSAGLVAGQRYITNQRDGQHQHPKVRAYQASFSQAAAGFVGLQTVSTALIAGAGVAALSGQFIAAAAAAALGFGTQLGAHKAHRQLEVFDSAVVRAKTGVKLLPAPSAVTPA